MAVISAPIKEPRPLVFNIVRQLPVPIKGCILMLCALFIAALFIPSISPHDPTRQDLRARLVAPTLQNGHLMGTDHLGRDLLARNVQGLRTSLTIALIGTLIGATIGTLLGVISAMLGGITDNLIMFFVDVQMAIPFTLLALIAVAIFGTNLIVFVSIIGLAGWDGYARMVRGQVLSAKKLEFVEAARALGARGPRVSLLHILPNILSPLIVLITFNFSSIVLLEASLSFLGLGVQPPNTSLGLLISFGREYLANAWWITLFPSLILVTITMSVSLIGDWLRDKFDPRLT